MIFLAGLIVVVAVAGVVGGALLENKYGVVTKVKNFFNSKPAGE